MASVEGLSDLVEPAVVIACASVILQGVKAVVDTGIQIVRQRTVREQRQLAYVASVLQLVDGLPVDAGEKAVLKLRILSQEVQGKLPEALRECIDQIVVTRPG